MKLCACNNCGHILADTNPKSDALEYPDIAVQSLVALKDTDNIPIDESFRTYSQDRAFYQGCPNCNTDAYLSDDSVGLFAKNGPNTAIIRAAINYYSQIEEYQEEDSTGWCQLQNLINLLFTTD